MALEKFRIFVDDSPGNALVGQAEQEDGTGHLNAKLAATNAAAKREPLGLRQPLGKATLAAEQQAQQQQPAGHHHHHHHHPQQQQQQATIGTSAISNASSTSIGLNDEDQENDISMASLGSDFVPSITHHDDRSFADDESFVDVDSHDENRAQADDDDETELDITSDEILNDNHKRPSNKHYNCYDDDEADEDGEQIVCDEEDLVDELLGAEDDEELAMELSQALEQHDAPQIFNCKVYIDDILSYLHQMERSREFRPLANYMDFQTDIDSEKRTILINWLVEVSDEFHLQTETFFMCTNLIDRYLSTVSVPTSSLQLLGVAAMFTASKYEEIYPPDIFQFVDITDETYSNQQIIEMEQDILKKLDFKISSPTAIFFLRQIFSYNKFPKKVYHLAGYLCHLSLVADKPFLEYLPSEIALASVILAAHQLGSASSVSADLKEAFDKSNDDQFNRRTLPKGVRLRDVDRRLYTVNKELPFCIESLRAFQEKAQSDLGREPSASAMYQRYSTTERNSVALLPAIKVEDLKKIVQ